MLDYRYARWKPEQFALRNGYLAEYITAQILKDHWYKGQLWRNSEIGYQGW